MYLVLTDSDRTTWVSGIFAARTSVDAYLAILPASTDQALRVIHDPELTFPFALIEDASGISALSVANAETRLEELFGAERSVDDEHVYCNVYSIDQEFIPGVPGRDEMGALRHVHIQNRHLARFRAGGFGSLW